MSRTVASATASTITVAAVTTTLPIDTEMPGRITGTARGASPKKRNPAASSPTVVAIIAAVRTAVLASLKSRAKSSPTAVERTDERPIPAAAAHIRPQPR